MAYTKQTWADLPSKTTPINATRLTHIEDGIFNAAQTADTAASTAGTAAANIGIVSSRVETLTERVNGLDTAVSNKVDKVAGKGLSTNDYDNTDKDKVDNLGTASTKNAISVVTDSSDLVESGAVYDAIKGDGTLLKDTVGFVGKNLYNAINEAETADGITITKNEFGEYTVTGKATALHQFSLGENVIKAGDYILNGCPSGGGSSTYDVRFTNNAIDNGQGATLHLDNDTAERVMITVRNGYEFPSGGLVFRPMIRKADIVDPTFEPYHSSVEEYCASKEDVINTVGWIQRNLVFKTMPNANINVDGGIRTSTYSLAVAKVKANKVYTISPQTTVFVYGFFTSEPTINSISYNNSREVVNKDTAQAETFTAPIDGYIVVRFAGESSIKTIQVEEGSTATPIHKPIEETKADNSVIGTVEDGATASQAYAVGEHFIRNGKFCTVTQAISSGGTLTEGTNYTAGDVAETLSCVKGFRLGTFQFSTTTGVSTGNVTFDTPFPSNIDSTRIAVFLSTISGNSDFIFMGSVSNITLNGFSYLLKNISDELEANNRFCMYLAVAY